MDLSQQSGSLLFNTLSSPVIAFLLWCMHLLISWVQLVSAVILHPKKTKSVKSFQFFPFYLPWNGDGLEAMSSVFWMLSLELAFSLSSCILIKRLFCFSSLFGIRVVLSAYLRLLVFLLATLIPACDPSSLAFHMMYFTYKLNKLGLFLVPEKAMAPHSSIPAWKIPWIEEPGRLQSMGSLRVGHDWATSLSLFTFMHWRRKWQPTPVFMPGESQGRGRLVGCCLWGLTESDTTEVTEH